MSHDVAAGQKFFKAPRYLLRKQNIIRQLKRLPVDTVADIGCGAGELVCTLAQKGYRGIGIDFSDDALAVAKSIKKKRNISDEQLTFKKGSLDVLTRKSDVVICCEVIEHLEDDDAFLRDVINYGEYFIFSVPARMKWFDQFDEKVGHFRRYEKNDLKQQLSKHGYEVIEFSAYGYPFINLTRLIRKALAGKVKRQKNIEEMTKQSGINPIKSRFLHNLDIELAMKPLYWLSRPFNGLNLSEGYVVLCKKQK